MVHKCNGREVFNVTKEIFFSLIIAAAGHDVDHPGHNNHFELKTKSILATVYNDKSILENHHCATVFKIASEEESGIFENLTPEMYKTCREWIVEMILATDMSLHFKNLGTVKSKIDSGEVDLMGED